MGGNALPTMRFVENGLILTMRSKNQVFGHVDIIYEIDALEFMSSALLQDPQFLRIIIVKWTKPSLSWTRCDVPRWILTPGIAHFGRKELVHTYKNTTEGEVSILCIDRPKFIRDDEVESDQPLGERSATSPARYFGEETPAWVHT